MVGICSLSLSLPLADSFRFEDAAASGIGRCFRSGSRLGNGNRFGGGSFDRNRFRTGFHRGGFGGGIFGSLELFGRRRIEDAIGQRSERGLKRRQDLLAGVAVAVVSIAIQ